MAYLKINNNVIYVRLLAVPVIIRSIKQFKTAFAQSAS